MIAVSTGEFRANQKKYLDKVDEGQVLLVTRSHGRSYKITPVEETDYASTGMELNEPDDDLARAVSASELLQGIEKDIREMYRKRSQK